MNRIAAKLQWFVHGVLGRVKLLIDRVYAIRHPGRLELGLIGLLAPAVRRMYPNDRWSLSVHAPMWMKAVDVPNAPMAPRPHRIFMFGLYRGQFTVDLAFASLLAWRGHTVTFGYLPKLRSPIKKPLQDHESAPGYLARALAGVEAASRGRVRVVDLSKFYNPDAPVDEAFLHRQAMSDTVMGMMRETIDLSDPELAETYEYYRRLGAMAQRSAWSYLHSRQGSFDLAIIGNGTTFESSNVCSVLRRCGVPFNTYEKFAFRNVRVINHGNDFRSFLDLERVWRYRGELGYAGAYRDAAAAKARQLLDERRRSSTATWAWSLQRSPTQDTDAALEHVGIDPSKPFVLVCTNVPYDAGYDKLCRIFPSMRAWLVHTVRLLLDRTDLTVVVRAHPGEAAHYGGKERSEDNLAAAGLDPGPRLIVLPGADPVNTYGLMERCKFGIVFSSTTGLEMAMMGKQVVIGADVYYGQRGFTVDVDDVAAYDQQVVRLARAPEPLSLSADQSTDAALFHFMLHYVMQWPYPWDKAGFVRDLPPHRLVASPQIARYLPMLDSLATLPQEYETRFADYLSVDKCTHLPGLAGEGRAERSGDRPDVEPKRRTGKVNA
jgi:hypothetical protein